MSTDIKPGKYHAVVLDYGVSTSKAGLPVVNVKFGFGEHTLMWSGSLKDGKAMEMTVKTLITLGLSSVDRMHELTDGAKSGLLDTAKEFEIDVQTETYEGKTFLKIKWVNDIGFRNLMTKEAFKAALATMNIRGSFMLAKENLAMRGSARKSDAQAIDEIPF